MKQDLALGRTEGSESIADSVLRPALNIRGLRYGDVGELATNVISSEAKASIDFRLVPDQIPEKIRDATEAFLQTRGWHIVREDPTPDLRRLHPKIVKLVWNLYYPGYRSDMDSPPAEAVITSIERMTESSVLVSPTTGGSAPMHTFSSILEIPLVIVPIVNHDNNQHGANENIRIQNLWSGIEVYAALLADLRW